MPLYEYHCKKDGRFELIRKFSDPRLKACPTCGRKVEKLLSSPAIQFKGTGWYVTDYARKGKDGASKEGKDGNGKDSSASGKSDGAAKSDGSAKSEGASKAESASKSDRSSSKTDSSSSSSKPAASSKAGSSDN